MPGRWLPCHAVLPVDAMQKYSQQRELARQLRRFIVTGADFHALLLHLLRELVREERNNMRLLGNMEDEIIVPTRWEHVVHIEIKASAAQQRLCNPSVRQHMLACTEHC